MKKLITLFIAIFLTVGLILTGCGTVANNEQAKTGSGTLRFTANGEDFIRQGFVTKDGWNLTFDHVYVTLAEITGYQSEPPYEPEKEAEIKAKETVKLEGTFIVDLAEGDDGADPILVGEVKGVPTGHYNALSWNMVKASTGDFAGSAIVMIGKAEKDGQIITFTIKLDRELNYRGGDFIGDERKGFVTEETNHTADLEMTFHFDHLFGDGNLSADDELNLGAFGFEPFASLSKDGKLDISMQEIKAAVSPELYQTLLDVFPGLGHVGEGHCYSEEL